MKPSLTTSQNKPSIRISITKRLPHLLHPNPFTSLGPSFTPKVLLLHTRRADPRGRGEETEATAGRPQPRGARREGKAARGAGFRQAVAGSGRPRARARAHPRKTSLPLVTDRGRAGFPALLEFPPAYPPPRAGCWAARARRCSPGADLGIRPNIGGISGKAGREQGLRGEGVDEAAGI